MGTHLDLSIFQTTLSPRAALIAATAAALFASVAAVGQDSAYRPQNQLIPAPACLTLKGAWEGGYTPCTAASHDEWLRDVRHWRDERRIRIGYSGARYDNPQFAWTQSSFMQPQMMAHDRYFYDPVAGRYTVDRYLDDLEKRYGGIDAVLIWPTYPNMGIDNRNQHDMIRAMPGGIPGVRQMIADFHRRGVRVLFPMMMWDQGTRDPGVPWTAGHRRVDEGTRRRRHQWRHAGRRAAGLFIGRGQGRAPAGFRARRAAPPTKRWPGI